MALGGHSCFIPCTYMSSGFHSQYTSYSLGHFIFTHISLVSHLVFKVPNDCFTKDLWGPGSKLIKSTHLTLNVNKGFTFLGPFDVPQKASESLLGHHEYSHCSLWIIDLIWMNLNWTRSERLCTVQCHTLYVHKISVGVGVSHLCLNKSA